jgi:hypothetical protein
MLRGKKGEGTTKHTIMIPQIPQTDRFKQQLREIIAARDVKFSGREDWEGKMFSDYKMKADVSNVVIIDKAGRNRFFTSDEVKAEEIHEVKELLKALASE